jgi:hypothetical protein
MKLFVLGYPSPLGGADTELWHVVRLWRQFGAEVTLIPTWGARPRQQARLKSIGAKTITLAKPCELLAVSGLRDSIVLGFCNSEFIASAAVLRDLNCRLVWVNCMTYITDAEIKLHQNIGPFDAYVFQSLYQQARLKAKYCTLGAEETRFHHIRGAFFPDEFPFQQSPRSPTDAFIIGRIARPDLAKWSSDLWLIYGAVRASAVRARVMAWSEKLSSKCGAPPPWAEALPVNAESTSQFIGSLHCMLPVNGGAEENWPRAGLEAMACGVPVVAEDAWGWCEMIEHGTTGFLAEPDRLAEYASLLAEDEGMRLRICRAARERLESEIANAELIWRKWKSLFDSFSGC